MVCPDSTELGVHHFIDPGAVQVTMVVKGRKVISRERNAAMRRSRGEVIRGTPRRAEHLPGSGMMAA
ncbi:hypothetical protein [Streptosporangium sp. OZ121]|uniref:hypothetical protein n=1 Tax=Streptosporangium sp. OZ121 TaxID=3444183 RepID=UPI003F798825